MRSFFSLPKVITSSIATSFLTGAFKMVGAMEDQAQESQGMSAETIVTSVLASLLVVSAIMYNCCGSNANNQQTTPEHSHQP